MCVCMCLCVCTGVHYYFVTLHTGRTLFKQCHVHDWSTCWYYVRALIIGEWRSHKQLMHPIYTYPILCGCSYVYLPHPMWLIATASCTNSVRILWTCPRNDWWVKVTDTACALIGSCCVVGQDHVFVVVIYGIFGRVINKGCKLYDYSHI